MDKVIKFRAWSTENKKMYPVDEFTCNWNRNFVTKTSELVIKSTNILMQFTGLYDCEGKEIWEGDIVNAYDNNCLDNIGVIEYYLNSFNLVCKNIHLSQWINAENIYVLGNIYEHPNLLNNE